MPRRFDFISPGVSIREIDQSELSAQTNDPGILIIGTAPQGPANKPVKVKNLEDFYRVFGRPISGKGSTSTDVWRDGNQQATTYGMYAAQAWLASETSGVTFYRLLGSDQETAKQGGSYVKAGWSTGYAASRTATSVATAYGLFVMPSGAAGQVLTGSLAAVIYSTGSSWALSGAVVDGTNNQGANTLITSLATGGKPNTFALVNSGSGGETKFVVHFDRSQKDGYIRNVLNCNPQKMDTTNFGGTAQTYFLGETFEEAASRVVLDKNSGSAGQQYGILVPLSDGTRHYSKRQIEATAGKTGWFINRNPSPSGSYADYNAATASKLFRLVSLHEGEWFQQNYGVRIDNIRIGTQAKPTSTFSLVIVNANGEEVERFDSCNLNESSADFIGKKIGDQYTTFDQTTKKLKLYGEYSNKSDYVRVEMASDWKAGISDKRMVPFGVWGPAKPNSIIMQSGSAAAADPDGGTKVIAKKADDGVFDMGHTGSASMFSHLYLAGTKIRLEWPSLKLTDQNSNAGGNYTKDYVLGVRHMLDADSRPKKELWFSPDYKDIVRALPDFADIHTDGDYTEISWIFSLDEIIQDSNDSSKYYYESGSQAGGTAYTAKSGSGALLTEGIKQFNAPFFGGFDGLDVRNVDPFSVANGTNANQDATKHYAYYSVTKALDIIKDKDLLEYDLISMPGLVNSTLTLDMIRIAEERADTLAIVDLDSGYKKSYDNNGTEDLGSKATVIADAVARDLDTSYAAAYYPNVRVRDTANSAGDVTVLPASVAAIGAIGFSEANSQGPWFAPAGFNRGGIGVLGGSAGPRVVGTLEHLTKQDRDDLYEENINPIARFPSIGEIVIFGQKTLQQNESALDRINVRRLMIYLKREIGRVANTILFDQNLRTTWTRFSGRATKILDDVKSRFGISEYKLVLDETTTTADLVDRNIMYAKIFIKPARAIEFIALDFVITRSGVEF